MDLDTPSVPVIETVVIAQQLIGASISRGNHLTAVGLCTQQIPGLRTKLDLNVFSDIDADELIQHNIVKVDRTVGFCGAVRITISVTGINELGPRTENRSRRRGEEDAE